MDFPINDDDKCIYSKLGKNIYVIICLYVNDILSFRTTLKVVSEAKRFFESNFDMKDLSKEEVILERTRTRIGLKLSQEHYIDKTARKFKYHDCKLELTLT